MESKKQIEENLELIESTTGMGRMEISEDLGYSKGYISEILGPNGTVTDKFLAKFKSKYQHLLTTQPPLPPTDSIVQLEDVTGKLIPLNDNRARVLPDYDRLIMEYFRNKNKATHFYRVEDLTMHALFFPGDLLLLVEDDTSIIISGEIFVIEFVNGKSTVRYVHYDPNNSNLFNLVPYNKSAGVTPGISRDLIKRMFKIVHLSRQLESPINNSVIAFK